MANNAIAAACLWILIWPVAGKAGSSEASAIDELCAAIRSEFVEAAPVIFGGPDPWVQLERLPDSFADMAVATVYYEGPRVRWVVLELQGPGEAWFETTHYFFDQQGRILKRQRHLESREAQTQVNEDVYFRARKVIKKTFRHERLGDQKEDWETFYDPNAPYYMRTGDLPAVMLKAEFTELARMTRQERQCLLKFTRPVIFFDRGERLNYAF